MFSTNTSPQNTTPQITYRTTELQEIRNFYNPRTVLSTDDCHVILSNNRAEGPICFAVPKLLPINTRGTPIDLTEAVADCECLLSRELGIICFDTIFARLGHLFDPDGALNPGVRSGARYCIPHGLLFGRPHTADALYLEVHYSSTPAWGHHHDPLPADKFPGEVLLHKSEPLNGIHWVDFWLVQIGDALPLFRKYYIRTLRKRLHYQSGILL